LKSKHGTPGFDSAGYVESVGAQVTRFKPGDAVFGASRGTCAEYVLASVARLARGQKLLIIGAAGGIGSFAAQIAHWCTLVRRADSRP